MHRYESFGECLKRCLKEAGLSASEAARLVGFRSRNSIFRILSGDTSGDVNLRFLSQLHDALGGEWPEERWLALEEALIVERLGAEKYRDNQAFQRVLYQQEEQLHCTVDRMLPDHATQTFDLEDILDEIAKSARVEIVITGCCDAGLTRLLAERCGEAGAQGRLNIRHYINTEKSVITQNILGILPLVSKPWYNARLVEPGSCPEEMMAIYRLHALHVQRWDAQGQMHGGMFIRFDQTHFASQMEARGACDAIMVLDKYRFELELLKPMPQLSDGPEVFVEYTDQYRWLEKDGAIYSIKPDVHFNCIPAELLEQAIIEGFQQNGIAAGPELEQLVAELKRVHNERYANVMNKHRVTHLVYSLTAMERFMKTGVQSDHFFIQRAYTVEERRKIVSGLLSMMRENPWFNVHFLRDGTPELRYEITLYEGKGVLMMDAYTGYELKADHSEALVTLPTFMDSFRSYFMEELLVHHVMSRGEAIQALEGLLVMNAQE